MRYDRAVTEAQVLRKQTVEYRQDGSAADIRAVWDKVKARLMEHTETLDVQLSNATAKSMEGN